MVVKMAFLEDLSTTDAEVPNSKSFVSGTEKYHVVLEQAIDVAAECAKAKQELAYQRGFVRSIEGKLSNEKFVGSAPAQVVDNERKKLADGLARIGILEETLEKMGCLNT